MQMNLDLIVALVTAGTAGAILGYALVKGILSSRDRLRTEATGTPGSFRSLLAPFGQFVLGRRGKDPELDRELTRLEKLVLQAGGTFLDGATGAEVFAARFVLPLVALVAFALLGAILPVSRGLLLLLACVFAVLLYFWPQQALADAAKRRVRQFSRELPPSLDVMRLVAQSGGDLQEAIRVVVEVSQPGPVREELAHALGEVAIGASLVVALNNVATRVDTTDANAVFSTMAQALEMGTSVTDNLGQAAALIRKAARTRAQERAQKAVVAMTFPLLLLILPGVFIVLFAPLLIQFAMR